MKTCSPKGRDCIELHSADTFNCSTNCEGVYADIQWIDEPIEKGKKEYLVGEKMKKTLAQTNFSGT